MLINGFGISQNYSGVFRLNVLKTSMLTPDTCSFDSVALIFVFAFHIRKNLRRNNDDKNYAFWEEKQILPRCTHIFKKI